MKKILIVLAAVGLTAGSGALVYAAEGAAQEEKSPTVKIETVRGTIISLDPAAKQIVIEESNGTRRTLNVTEEIIARLWLGERVVVSVPAGSDTAVKIEKIRRHRHPDRREG